MGILILIPRTEAIVAGLNITKGNCNTNATQLEKGDIVTNSLLTGEKFLLFGQYFEGDPMDVESYIYANHIEVDCGTCGPQLFDEEFDCFFE